MSGGFISEPKMGVVGFGNALFDTEDLDPVYICLYKTKLEERKLKQILLAYWMTYHLGVSCRIAESGAMGFWPNMRKFHEGKWPRGRERRHFRGEASSQTIGWFEENYPLPQAAVDSLEECNTFTQVKEKVTRWPQFGPWIAFKVADMLERVLGWPVEFTYEDLGFYEEPAAGAKLILPDRTLEETIRTLESWFSGVMAPPRYDRPVGIQECETVCCKYHAYCENHYRIGEDIDGLYNALSGWGDLAEEVRRWLPNRVLK